MIIVAFAIEGAITGKGLLRPWPPESEESSAPWAPQSETRPGVGDEGTLNGEVPLTAPTGRSLTVYVRDTEDLPVCSALVRVFGKAGEHVVVRDGVQELSLLTDREGRIDILGTPPHICT